jgi:hypothetical protein
MRIYIYIYIHIKHIYKGIICLYIYTCMCVGTSTLSVCLYIYTCMRVGTSTLSVSSTNSPSTHGDNKTSNRMTDFLPKFVHKHDNQIIDDGIGSSNDYDDNNNYNDSDNKGDDDTNDRSSRKTHQSSVVRKRKNKSKTKGSGTERKIYDDDKNDDTTKSNDDNRDNYDNDKQKNNVRIKESVRAYRIFNMNTISIAIQATFSSFLKHLLTGMYICLYICICTYIDM